MRVLGARVVVKEKKLSEKTSTGIVIPGREKQQTNQGEIILVGEGALTQNGDRIPLSVKVGESVLYTSFSGTPVVTENESELVILNERDILCVL